MEYFDYKNFDVSSFIRVNRFYDVFKKVSSNMIYGVLNFILVIFSLVNAYVNKKYKNSLILIYFIIFF